MTTVETGNKAERAAAAYLQQRGFTILQRNFRRPYCEIDIVAGKQRIIYFVEVKYRSSKRWGGGLDYITPAKLRQMRRAARVWVEHYKWRGEYQLAAIEVCQSGIGEFVLLS